MKWYTRALISCCPVTLNKHLMKSEIVIAKNIYCSKMGFHTSLWDLSFKYSFCKKSFPLVTLSGQILSELVAVSWRKDTFIYSLLGIPYLWFWKLPIKIRLLFSVVCYSPNSFCWHPCWMECLPTIHFDILQFKIWTLWWHTGCVLSFCLWL